MSRAHCLDCGTDVPVDPLGHCPAGHLLPANGHMVESAIGSDDYHPDEPEPWVAAVNPPAAEPAVAAPSAQPRTAPGLDPAENEADTGDLLRELGALGADDDPGPAAPGPSASTGVRTSVAPSTSPPAVAPGPERREHQVPGARTSGGDEPAVSQHAALEQAIQSLDQPANGQAPSGSMAPASPAPPAAPAAPAAPATEDELSSLFEEFEGIGGAESEPHPAPAPPAPQPDAGRADGHPAPPPVAPPGAPDASAPQPASPPPAPASPPSPPPAWDGDAPGAQADGPPSRSSVDTMNFTAKGGAMNGRRRRRRFGR